MKRILALVLFLTVSFSAYAMEERWLKLMQMLEEGAEDQVQQPPDSFEQAFAKWDERVQEIERKKAENKKQKEIETLMTELQLGCQKQK